MGRVSVRGDADEGIDQLEGGTWIRQLGGVEFAEELPNDGKVIDDQRSYE